MSNSAQGPSAVASDRTIRRVLYLSGGGFRASLGAIGALLLIAHMGWWSQVRQIVSVSGGGIVNAWLATRQPSTDPELQETLDELFVRLSDRARTARHLVVALGAGVIGIGTLVVTIVAIRELGAPALTIIAISCAVVLGAAIVFSLVPRLFLRVEFSGFSQHLGSIVGSRWRREHTFVASDLLRSRSVYFSAHRTAPTIVGAGTGVFDARELRYWDVLRATTALPPIVPPLHVRLRSQPRRPRGNPSDWIYEPIDLGAPPRRIWAIDGGATGNLGVQASAEWTHDDSDAHVRARLVGELRDTDRFLADIELREADDSNDEYEVGCGHPGRWSSCRRCTTRPMVVDSSGRLTTPGLLSRLGMWLPGLSNVVNAVRTMKVEYEEILRRDQASVEPWLVSTVRSDRIYRRAVHHDLEQTDNALLEEFYSMVGRDIYPASDTRAAMRELDFIQALLCDRASEMSTGLFATAPDRAAAVVASGYVGAYIASVPDPSATGLERTFTGSSSALGERIRHTVSELRRQYERERGPALHLWRQYITTLKDHG